MTKQNVLNPLLNVVNALLQKISVKSTRIYLYFFKIQHSQFSHSYLDKFGAKQPPWFFSPPLMRLKLFYFLKISYCSNCYKTLSYGTLIAILTIKNPNKRFV